MVILLLPLKENKTLAKELASLLENFGGVIHITENSIFEYANLSPEFLLMNTDSLRSIHAETVLYLQTDDSSAKHFHNFTPDKIITVSNNNEAAENLITIGSNAQCTLSVSSNNENKLHIALQNTLATLNGTSILPCEIAVNYEKDYSLTALLFLTAILLLCEKLNTQTLEIDIK